MSYPFEIIVGTYEQYLLGYKVHNVVNEYKIEKSFATHSHIASIRSVASSKHYLASAGADDTVCLYDMRHRIESGRLMHHNDTINCAEFTPEASHLFTCSKDGSIAAIRCGNWQTEKYWPQAHKGSAVNTLAIHPTGKLALSTGMDGVLRTWNLVKGRQAYAINLVPSMKYDAKNVTIIKWSPNGEKYLLAVNQRIDVYAVEIAGIERELTFDSKIICVEFLKDNLIAVGFEDGQIKFCDLRTSERTLETAAHDIRVKCIAHMNNLLVSASSSGEIKVWKYNRHSLDILQTVNCGARITCLSLALPCKSIVVQQNQIKLEEEKKVKKKSKLILRQEVIIEDEGDEEETNIANFGGMPAKIKHRKKRAIEDSEENVKNSKKRAPESNGTIVSKKKRCRSSEKEDAINKPTKRKMLNKANLSNEKRRKDSAVSQVISPVKKIKWTSEIIQPSITHKKYKIKSSMTTNIDAPPRKKTKQKIDFLEKVLPQKRKRRAMQ